MSNGIVMLVGDLHGQQIRDAFDSQVLCHFRQADELWGSAGRVSTGHAIIDIDMCDPATLAETLGRYRYMTPRTHIILIAQGRQPGDPLVAGIVTKTMIGDIVAADPDQDVAPAIRDYIAEPNLYSNAARWISDVQPTAVKTKIVKEIVEKPVEVEKAVFLSAPVIAVAGSMHRIGTTHTALTIANCLAEGKKGKIAIIDHAGDFSFSVRPFSSIRNEYTDHVKTIDDTTFSLGDITFFCRPVADLHTIRQQYQYVIIDYGMLTQSAIYDYTRHDFQLLCSGTKDWEAEELSNLMRNYPTLQSMAVRHLFNFTSIMAYDAIREQMAGRATYLAPYSPDPLGDPGLFLPLLSQMLPAIFPASGGKKESIIDRLRQKVRAKT